MVKAASSDGATLGFKNFVRLNGPMMTWELLSLLDASDCTTAGMQCTRGRGSTTLVAESLRTVLYTQLASPESPIHRGNCVIL
jgi:hypothetical protein